MCNVCREFRLSSAHPNNSRAALAERILAERRTEASFMPRTNARSSDQGSRLSDAATLEGDARIARLAQPRTQLWNKCETPQTFSSHFVSSIHCVILTAYLADAH